MTAPVTPLAIVKLALETYAGSVVAEMNRHPRRTAARACLIARLREMWRKRG